MTEGLSVVLLARDSPSAPGGIPTYTSALAAHLRKLGTKVNIVAGGTDGRTLILPLRLDLSGYDIVHVQSAPYAALVSRHPLVVTSHSPTLEEGKYYRTRQKFRMPVAYLAEKTSLAKADAVIAVSSASTRVLIEKYGVDSRRILLIPNGVDLEHFVPGEKISESGPPKVLICSRLEPRKNVEEALVALSEIGDVPFEVEVIGDGSARRQLEELSKRLGLRASFRGAVRRRELYSSFAETDIFVSTSRSEGFGLSALEAMASGCAVVLSGIQAHREFVSRMQSGMLYSGHQELVESLRRLLRDRALVRQLGDNARIAASSYSWDIVAQSTLRLYRLLLRR